ncbi:MULTISPECIES: hypothetical protein [Nostoc]|uniref:Uncharacterized protein n=2 Tax=Nostoc TaxID=1177 RepID=A0ABR8IIT3_9NOSO|nr:MULTISPECIES: hypothetical protein [Nostoc]MBD2565601.1 hypothetical protein [Nostoc linckia FACHB-391]MBD2651074.1 hypothetical protein [Nostoc foliaceum FACHB-393]
MTRAKKLRKSLSLPRFQPMENTPLAVVADYLNSLEVTVAKRLLEEMLVMYFLPRAQYKLGGCEKQQLTNSYLISRRMAESHFGIMALELGLEASVYSCVSVPLNAAPAQSAVSVAIAQKDGTGDSANLSTLTPSTVEQAQTHHSSLIAGEESVDLMDQLFS